MVVKIYVDWSAEEVYTEKDFQTLWERTAAEIAEEDDALQEFLVDDKYMGIADVFRLTDVEKAKLTEEFKQHCMDYAWANLVDEGSISQEEIEV